MLNCNLLWRSRNWAGNAVRMCRAYFCKIILTSWCIRVAPGVNECASKGLVAAGSAFTEDGFSSYVEGYGSGEPHEDGK